MPSWFNFKTTTATTKTKTTKKLNQIDNQNQNQNQNQFASTSTSKKSTKSTKFNQSSSNNNLSIQSQNQNDQFNHFQPSSNPLNQSQSSSLSLSPELSSQYHFVQHQNPNDQVEVLTQSLAIRLEELATANHDGLLDDDEYRTLRKGLFDQINAGNQFPLLIENSLTRQQSHSIHSIPFDTPSENLIPSPAQIPFDPSTISTHHNYSQNGSFKSKSNQSINSSSSLLHKLFKRHSHNGNSINLESQNQLTIPEVHQNFQSFSNPSNHNNFNLKSNSNPTNSSIQFQSARSLRIMNNNHLYPSSDTSEPSVRSSVSTRNARIETSSSRRPLTSLIRESLSTSDHHHPLTPKDDYRQIEWTSDQIQQEIHELELECAKLLETFDLMEKNSIAKYRTVPHSQPIDFSNQFNASDRLINSNLHQSSSSTILNPIITTRQNTVLHEPTRLHVQPMTSSSSHSEHQPHSLKHRSSAFFVPLIKRKASKTKGQFSYRDTKTSLINPPPSSIKHQASIFKINGHKPSIKRNHPPNVLSEVKSHESELNPNEASIHHFKLTPNHSNPMQPSFNPNSNCNSPSPSSSSIIKNQFKITSDHKQESELELELKSIQISKLKVEKKYHDRLLYLRAKLKGALIRESNL